MAFVAALQPQFRLASQLSHSRCTLLRAFFFVFAPATMPTKTCLCFFKQNPFEKHILIGNETRREKGYSGGRGRNGTEGGICLQKSSAGTTLKSESHIFSLECVLCLGHGA